GSGASIHDGTINYNAPAGYAIYSNAPSISIYGNTVSNNNTDQSKTPHGIAIYNTTGGHVYQNSVSGFCPAYLAALTDATTMFDYNIVMNPYGNYQLYAKGATGSKFYNNTVYARTGYNGVCMGMQDNGVTHSTGVEYKNNICYDSSTSPKFLFTDANQTATFSNNLYYSPEALIATSWQYGGSNYSTFANWQSAEASAIWGDPLFVSSSDYNLQSTSPAINAGIDVSLTADYAGNPICGLPDVGAYENCVSEEEEEEENDLNVHSVKLTSTENSVTLKWKTDNNTKSIVKYGINKNIRKNKKDNDKEKNHKMTIKNLLPNTQYYFKIKAKDSENNEDSSRVHSIKTLPRTVIARTVLSSQKENQAKNETAPNACSYVVEPGDALWSIAKKIYGDPTAYLLIIEKNKNNYPNIGSKLLVGQKLTFDCDN
ncbi:MAG TPA: fibronectin type III domain-containing protein, partial [Candidatus Moranbacteria bacterium]|nr:fibronectin type III domain-containing protein [Candidatus Moranbacteria bacterium]